jgi:hypothetical protein
LPGEGVED